MRGARVGCVDMWKGRLETPSGLTDAQASRDRPSQVRSTDAVGCVRGMAVARQEASDLTRSRDSIQPRQRLTARLRLAVSCGPHPSILEGRLNWAPGRVDRPNLG